MRTIKKLGVYTVVCSYGTLQRTWTKQGALEWLAACGPEALVVNFWGQIVAMRQATT